MKRIIVGNEREAFDLLQKALKKEIGDKPFILEFNNWPLLSIKLEGKGYDSTITPDMAEALVEVQRALNRTYARFVHNTANARSLTDMQRQDIQFKAKVKKGSSVIEINLGDFAEKLATSIGDKMTPEMITLSVVGTALAAAGYLSYKAFLKHRSDDKQIEQTERTKLLLSQEETKRLEVFANAMKRAPALRHVNEDFDEARNEILKGTGDAQRLSVNELPIESETARAIATAKRTPSSEIQLNGTYLIKGVDLRQEGEVRLRVENQTDGREFVATFQDNSLDSSQIALLQKAEWSRTKVYLSINARILRGEVTSATVISAQEQPAKA